VGYHDEVNPCALRFAYGDHVSATYGAYAMLAALVYRNRTGKGQYIDISEWEATTSLLGEPLMDYIMNKRVQKPRGNRVPDMAPHGFYPCKGDYQWVSIAVKTEEDWRRFCKAIGSPPWSKEARFSDLNHRLRNQDALDKLLGEWTKNYTPYEATEILQEAGVAAAPFMISKDQYHDPHFQARGTFVDVIHPKSGPEVLYGVPWRLSDTPGKVRSSGPLLGGDNEYVFKGLLNVSDEEYNRLVEGKVIF
jgi:benzylsuccinate CoA-transferase BbsF subunit